MRAATEVDVDDMLRTKSCPDFRGRITANRGLVSALCVVGLAVAVFVTAPGAERSPEAARAAAAPMVADGGLACKLLPAIAFSDRDDAPAAAIPAMMPAIVETEISLDEFEIRDGDHAISAAPRRDGRHSIRSATCRDAATMLAVGSTDLARLCRRLL